MFKMRTVMALAIVLLLCRISPAQTADKKSAPQEPQTISEALKAVQEYPNQKVQALRAAGQPINYSDILREKTEMAKKYAARFSASNIAAKDLPILARLYREAGEKELARATIAKALSEKQTDAERADTLVTAIDVSLSQPISDEGIKEAEGYATRLDSMGDVAIDQQVLAHNKLGNLYRGMDVDAGITAHEDKFLALYKKLDPTKQKKLAPRVAASYTNLAEVYAGRQENDRALAILKRGLAEFSDNPQISMSLQRTFDRYSMVGKQAPAIEAPMWINAPADLKRVDLRGQVTLIQFTAHWCGPCRKSYPMMLKMHNKFAKDGLQVLFVTELYGFFEKQQNLNPAQELAADQKYYVEHHAIPFKVAVAEASPDPRSAQSQTLPPTNENKYFVSGIPQIVVIDKQGIVRSILIGWDPANEERLTSLLDRLLKEPIASAK